MLKFLYLSCPAFITLLLLVILLVVVHTIPLLVSSTSSPSMPCVMSCLAKVFTCF